VKFAAPYWLFGSAFALVVALLLVAGALGLTRARIRFGAPERVWALTTFDPTLRRSVKGVLLVLATALAFVALARPQYSRGQRLVPATNLDVVVVMDFSKSMYARDVVPSRIARAKAEVARLVRELAGARFGAVAFAGEPLGFPLTSDGAAIAQFLRQTEPNDMPIGGTAIARALERGREILLRDPKSKDHRRVVLLITDGEDLEGDPVDVARSMATEGTQVNVVQIGGRTPERIPEVGPDGHVLGWRTDDAGKPLTTELSAEGEAQLAQVAQVGNGRLIRAEKGSTGLEEMTRHLKKMMTTELAERVETVYEDKFAWPLSLALVLVVIETFLNEAPTRKAPKLPAPPRGRPGLPKGARRPSPRGEERDAA
jgi:Ca-activated chloride channel homolog